MPEYFHATYIFGCKRNTAISANKPKYTFLLLTSVITSVVRHFYNKTLVCTFTVATLHHMNICYDYLPLNSIPLCALYQGCPGYIN